MALNFCGGIVSDLRLELELTVPYPERSSDDLRLGVLRYQSSLLGPSEAEWSQLTASRHIQKTWEEYFNPFLYRVTAINVSRIWI